MAAEFTFVWLLVRSARRDSVDGGMDMAAAPADASEKPIPALGNMGGRYLSAPLLERRDETSLDGGIIISLLFLIPLDG